MDVKARRSWAWAKDGSIFAARSNAWWAVAQAASRCACTPSRYAATASGFVDVLIGRSVIAVGRGVGAAELLGAGAGGALAGRRRHTATPPASNAPMPVTAAAKRAALCPFFGRAGRA